MQINRRNLLKGFSTVGALGATALAMAASSRARADTAAAYGKSTGAAIKGPYLDLTTGSGNKIAYARLQGDTNGKQKYGWYKGYVMGVRPDNKIDDLFGFEGFGVSRLEQREDGSIAKILREVGLYTDLRSGEVLETWKNPYLDEEVRVVPVANDPFNIVIRDFFPDPPAYGGLNKEKPPKIPFILPWIQRGDRLDMEIHIHLHYPSALQPDKWVRESPGPMVRVSEMFAHHMKAADMQNPEMTKVPHHGVWNRVTPWLPWMLMGQTPGHCQYACFMGSGEDLEEVHSRQVLDYVEKHYAKYFQAPDKWEEPSLSSLENYAREQTHAPPKE